MATIDAEQNAALDLRERIARIDAMLADHDKNRAQIEALFADRDRKHQEMRLAPWQIAITAIAAGATMMGAGAALFAAGGAFFKLLGS